MKRLVLIGSLLLLFWGEGFSSPAGAWVYAGNQGDTGWRTYTYLAGPDGFSGTAGFVVSNVLDNSAFSELLLDNLSQGGLENGDFENGNYSGYQLLGDSYGEVTDSFVQAMSGRIYTPQGDFMSHQLSLPPGVDTSGFRNAQGQAGTCGSILETAISLQPGEAFTFQWAFLGGDKSPYRDFSLFYLKDATGTLVFRDGLGQIGAAPAPHIPLLLLN
jgi:hypothetical protein